MTTLSRPYRALLATAAVTALLAATACSGDDDKDKKSSSAPPPTTSTPAPTSSAPAKPAAVNPLRGGKASSNGVIGVKIDDTANGRPQRNIDAADIVYIEEVEGGLTRLLAVFHTNLPTAVEAVRSTRPADPELMTQYGKVGYVASGGQRISLRYLDRSPLKTSISDRGGPGLQRDGSRSAPYNVVANLKTIDKALKPAKARKVGFSWSTSRTQLAGAAGGTKVDTVVGGTPVQFRYNPKTKRYNRYIDGTLQHAADGKVISTPNVIVQFCKVEVFGRDRDVNGNPNAYTHTVGSGKLAVFRDGKRLVGKWSRSKASSGTVFHDGKGKPVLFRPGGAWVVLTRTGAPLG